MRAAKAKLMQSRLEQENMNEQMMLELTQAANNLDEAGWKANFPTVLSSRPKKT